MRKTFWPLVAALAVMSYIGMAVYIIRLNTELKDLRAQVQGPGRVLVNLSDHAVDPPVIEAGGSWAINDAIFCFAPGYNMERVKAELAESHRQRIMAAIDRRFVVGGAQR